MRVPMHTLGMVFTLLAGGPVSADEPNFRPGEWKLTSEVRLRGEPRATREWTETKCVTLDELRSGKLFMGKLDISGCDPGEPEVRDDRMTWQFECLDHSMGRRIEAEMDVRLHGDRLEGVTEAEVTTARGALHATTQFRASRKGQCQ